MNLDQVRDLILSGQLLSEERFDEYRDAWLEGKRQAAEGDAFVRWLVTERELSDFQAQAVLAGVAGPYMLGPYRVTGRITAGRLGDVYQAEQAEFRQPVSLKVFPAALNQDPELTARLGREARVSLQVDSPYVVKTFQVGRVGSIPYIAMEALNGETLEQQLEREGRIDYQVACMLIQQAALGLAHVHSNEIVHRDICPANLWVSDQGVVKIMDFGAARDALSFVDSLGDDGEELTINQAGDSVLGHYAYMSAHQAEDPHGATISDDLYSLGCTFYHCLTGEVPFPDKNPVRQMLRHTKESPRPLSEFGLEIPPLVQDVVTRLLAKRPEDRYGSAEEVAHALTAVIPLATLPLEVEVVPEFLDWVNSVEDGAFVSVMEDPQDPEFDRFVTWLNEPGETPENA